MLVKFEPFAHRVPFFEKSFREYFFRFVLLTSNILPISVVNLDLLIIFKSQRVVICWIPKF